MTQHRDGSRKGKVHELFNKEGPEVAFTRGTKLGLQKSTLMTWFGTWRREQANKKTVTAATKKTAAKVKAVNEAKAKLKTAKRTKKKAPTKVTTPATTTEPASA